MLNAHIPGKEVDELNIITEIVVYISLLVVENWTGIIIFTTIWSIILVNHTFSSGKRELAYFRV